MAVEHSANVSAHVLNQYKCILWVIAPAVMWFSGLDKFVWMQLTMHRVFSSDTDSYWTSGLSCLPSFGSTYIKSNTRTAFLLTQLNLDDRYVLEIAEKF